MKSKQLQLFTTEQPGAQAVVRREFDPSRIVPLAPGYTGEDRNAAARDNNVVETMGWSNKAADAVIAHPSTDIEPYVAEGIVVGEEAAGGIAAEEVTAETNGQPLAGEARTSRIEQIRRGLAAIGLDPTNQSTREAKAYVNYVDMYSR